MKLINYKSILKCIVLLITIFLYSNKKLYSQNLRIKATNFNELMRETLATQDAVFEAEKKILSKKQI